jgi:hypothetical protein
MHRTKNTWRIDGDTLVLLDCHGVEIYCPAAAAPYVLQYTWRILYQHKNGKVHQVTTHIPNRNGATTLLHRLIMENVPHRPEQTQIDHIDGNPLNNRLDNLRYVSRSVNQQNKRDAEGKPNRGVYRHTLCWTRTWCAQIKLDGKRVETKSFSTAREAEEQFLIWKRQYHPETPEVWYEQYAACQASGYWDAPAPTNSSAPAPATLFESMESR